jgi:zinc transporter ZupT
MADDRNLLSERREDRVWAILRWIAVISVVLGAAGVVVGLVSGQSIGIILIDLMLLVVGGILLLILRWRL